MSAQPLLDPRAEADRLDMAADEAIALAGGDMRNAIRSLVLALECMERELESTASHGYVRGLLLQLRRPDWFE